MRFSKLIISFLCVFLGAVTVRGQTVSVTFHTYGINNELPAPKLFYKSSDKYLPLEVKQQFVDPASSSYNGPATMILYSAGRPQARSGSDAAVATYTPVGKVTFPSSGTYIVALYNFASGSIIGVAMKDDVSSFPGGSLRVFNATKLPLSITWGGKKFDVQPFAVGMSNLKTTGSVQFLISVTQGKDTIELTNENWAHSPTTRRSVFITQTNADKTGPDVAPTYAIATYVDDSSRPASGGASAPAKPSGATNNKGNSNSYRNTGNR